MKRTVVRVLSVITVFVLLSQPVLAAACEETDWLVRLNAIRAVSDLPPVADSVAMSEGCYLHARYMAENGVIGHDEDPALPYYSAAGDAAAAQSNCALGISGVEAIDLWAQGPFHALGMLDPRLTTAGFGSYDANDGGSAAALNVLGGRVSSVPEGITFPILFPGPGRSTDLLEYWGGESPDPLAGTGFSAPSGAPIIAQFGTGSGAPVVTAHGLSANGEELPHAVYTELTYENPDAASRSLGRAVLGMRDAIVLMPAQPLLEDERYSVSMTVDGQEYAWSFWTGDPLRLELCAPSTCAYAKPVTVSARLKTADYVPLPGRTVRIETSPDGEDWTTVAEEITDEDGYVYATIAATAKTYIRAVFDGDEELPAWESCAAVLKPSAAVSAPKFRRYVRRYRSYTATGVLNPAHIAGRSAVVIDAQRYESGRWVTRRRFTGKAYGTAEAHGFKVTASFPYRGTWRVRTRHVADGQNAAVVSSWKTVIVRRW